MDTSYPHIKPQKRPYPQRKTYLDGWRLYKGAFIQHHAQGFAIAVMVLSEAASFMAAAGLWAFLYVAYQVACFPRKRDSMGLDICDLIVGYVIGLVVITPLFLMGTS